MRGEGNCPLQCANPCPPYPPQMFVKMWTLGIQLMLPIAIVGCCVLVPISASGTYVVDATRDSGGESINPSAFMRMTMTNINDPNVLW